ncbi:MAG TPA: trypsin-like peptidase domain-containing protein, partial [Kineosporiaceae bacterium]|nr:trypsin-like peptidase domain-containing protein [Kineosporiaceae bacterium]
MALACSVEQQGSGFMISPEHVVTNAHVVQGLRGTSVQIGGVGRHYRARVVLFDPGVDLAVLDVPGLPARPLTVATVDPARGDAVVAA